MDSWYWSCSPGNGTWRSLNWILAQTNWNHFRLFITEIILAIYNYQVNGVYSLIILYHWLDFNLSNLIVQKNILDLIPSREGLGLDKCSWGIFQPVSVHLHRGLGSVKPKRNFCHCEEGIRVWLIFASGI